MIMLMSLAAFAALMLLCHSCSCNMKRQTLQTLDDVGVEPGGAIMECESQFDKTTVKPVEMMSQTLAKSERCLDYESHENLFDGPNERLPAPALFQEQLALGCPWLPLADKAAWWNPLDVWPRAPANPAGYSKLPVQVPPWELRTAPLVPNIWHQDIALGVPVDRTGSTDGFCLSERSVRGPMFTGPLISRPRTPGPSCSTKAGPSCSIKAEPLSGACTPSFPSLVPTLPCPSHPLRSPGNAACSSPFIFQDHVGKNCNRHERQENQPSVSSRAAPHSPVRPPCEGSLPECLQQAAMPPRKRTSPEWAQRAVMPPCEGASPEWGQRAGMPQCDGSSPAPDSQVAGAPNTRTRQLSPERVQTLQSTLQFVDMPFVRHDI